MYISIVANEGDTPKMAANLYNNGWLKQGRGKFPVNWGINPTHCVYFPSLMEYYYLTKTERDYFVMGPNGAGYNQVRENEHLDLFLAYTRKVNEHMQLSEIELWYANREQVERYATRLPGLRGLSLEPHGSRANGECFMVGDTPIIRHLERFYYWYVKGDLCTDCIIDNDKTTAFLNRLYEEGPLPRYVPIYGYEEKLIDEAAAFFGTLDPNKFEVVDYGTLFHYAAQTAKSLAPAKSTNNPGAIWRNDWLYEVDRWECMEGDAMMEVTACGLRVEVPQGQERVVIGIRDVVPPPESTELVVSTAKLSEGANWMFWMHGDYDGFGLSDKWEPFWKPNWEGARSEELPRRLLRYEQASDYLLLAVEGGGGAWLEFDGLHFK